MAGRNKAAKLSAIIAPYDDWFNQDAERHLQAKQALCRFYEELKKLKPDKEYKTSGLHMTYFFRIIQVKKALMEQKYTRVCNELRSLLYYEPFFQGRIYHNVLRLPEKSFSDFGGG